MIIDGKKISEEIETTLRLSAVKLSGTHVAILAVGGNPVTQNYLSLKQRFAEKIKVKIEITQLPDDVTEDEVVAKIQMLNADPLVSAVVVQLPLPESFNTLHVLQNIAPEKDADVLSPVSRDRSLVLPPVLGAMKEILRRQNVKISGKKAVIVGTGHLVGKPAERWLKAEGAEVKTLDIKSDDLTSSVARADILVLGAGHPSLITPDMVQQGVVILDAGTSESSGRLRGDSEPACAEKASLFTPVPGGIGPVAVAMLFQNVFELKK